jgi:predicted lipase
MCGTTIVERDYVWVTKEIAYNFAYSVIIHNQTAAMTIALLAIQVK